MDGFKNLFSLADLESQEGKEKGIRNVNKSKELTESEKQLIISRINLYDPVKESKERAMVTELNSHSNEPQFSNVIDPETNKPMLGCEHYPRNCRLQAACCGAWVVCRFCHDQHIRSHDMNCAEIKQLKCMVCNVDQPISNECINMKCKATFGEYYCPKYRMFDNTPNKVMYHCDDCNACLLGKREDHQHCFRCKRCYPRSDVPGHKCVRGGLDSNCPICGYQLTLSPHKVMPCGHAMHGDCYEKYRSLKRKTCPLCQKPCTIELLKIENERIDAIVAQEEIPEEDRNRAVSIFCYYCAKSSVTKFHHQYLKCTHCAGYNTVRDNVPTENAVSTSSVGVSTSIGNRDEQTNISNNDDSTANLPGGSGGRRITRRSPSQRSPRRGQQPSSRREFTYAA